MIINHPRNTTLYGIANTNTFRLGSSSIWKLWGSNLQNVEKEMRGIYWADKGYKLCQRDQSGAEALIVAYLCRKGKFRQLFDYAIKPHCYIGLAFPQHWQEKHPVMVALGKLEIGELAANPFWKPLEKDIKLSDDNPPSTRYYYHYKQTCHSSNYGIKAPTFRLNMLEKSGGRVVITAKQANEYLLGYHGMFPEIREWHQEVDFLLRKTGTLRNLFGFPRTFEGPFKPGDNKDAYAFVPQSTVGCITNIAYTRLQEYIEREGLDWDLLNNCHDSYLCQCPDGEEAECQKKMKEFMNMELVSPRGEHFFMKSEGQVGLNWGPRKEFKLEDGTIKVKNPDGLVTWKDN